MRTCSQLTAGVTGLKSSEFSRGAPAAPALLCRAPVGASRPRKHPSPLFLSSPEHATKRRRASHLLFPFRHPEGCSLLLRRAAQTLPRERPAPLRIRPLTHARLRHPARMILVPPGSGCFLRSTYVHCKPPEHVGCPVALCRFAPCPAAEDSLSRGGSTPLAFQQLPTLVHVPAPCPTASVGSLRHPTGQTRSPHPRCQLSGLHCLLRLRRAGSGRSQKVIEWLELTGGHILAAMRTRLALLGSTGSAHPAFNVCKSVVLSQGKRDPMQLSGRMSGASPSPTFPT